MPSRTAEVSTCPECQDAAGAASPPTSAGPLLTTRRRIPVSLVLVAINVAMFAAMVIKGA